MLAYCISLLRRDHVCPITTPIDWGFLFLGNFFPNYRHYINCFTVIFHTQGISSYTYDQHLKVRVCCCMVFIVGFLYSLKNLGKKNCLKIYIFSNFFYYFMTSKCLKIFFISHNICQEPKKKLCNLNIIL